MRVRDKEVVYLLFPQPGAFKLRQDSIPVPRMIILLLSIAVISRRF